MDKKNRMTNVLHLHSLFYRKLLNPKTILLSFILYTSLLPSPSNGWTEEDKLREKLEALEARIESEERERSKITISGEGKMRMRNVTSTNKGIIGSYGEPLKEGFTFKKRLDLSLKVRITDILSATGKIRISDETPQVIGGGPEYISGIIPWASWSLDLERERTKATLGNYEIFFTPLTLMRWDLEDNPKGEITGGGVSCGCTAEVTGVSPDSLEDLEPKPELTFEGLKIKQVLGENIDLIAISALPQIAKENKAYRQYLYGGRIKGFIYHPSSLSFRTLGITYLKIEDDKDSVSGAPYTPVSNRVLGVDFNLPIGEILTLFGEWVKSEKNTNLLLPKAKIKEGKGLIGGSKLTYPPTTLKTTLSYLQLDPEYDILYDAISYSGNKKGFRLSSVYESLDKRFTLSLFYKHLKEIEPTIDDKVTTLHNSLSSFIIANLGLSLQLIEKLTLYSGFDYRLNTRKDDKLTTWNEEIKNKKATITGAFTYNLDTQKSFTLRHRFINYQDEVTSTNDYTAQVTSLEVSLKF